MLATGTWSSRRLRKKHIEALAKASIGIASLFACACSGSDASEPGRPPLRAPDNIDAPIPHLDSDVSAAFNDGDLAFSTPMTNADGLGPLYTRTSCDSCHADGVRGPGLVQKMSVVADDGVTPSADQSVLRYGHTVHPLLSSGARTPIVPPSDDPAVLVTTRVGPPIIGRGYIEAIEDSELERVESEQAARSDQIHGRINHVLYASEMSADEAYHSHVKGDAAYGRFGLKARVATLDDFTADAFQGDMGITSPLRPTEFKNPDNLTDDGKPGVDVSIESVRSRATYLRLLAIPQQGDDAGGSALFAETLCAVCHVPSLHTRADYPIAQIADKNPTIYSDLLLHRMGKALADGLPSDPSVDFDASSFEWRTAPLIGLRFNRTFMHDGRARNVADAVLAHRSEGSEASDSVDRFEALSNADRKALIEFVEGL